jgi:hypothetical protein
LCTSTFGLTGVCVGMGVGEGVSVGVRVGVHDTFGVTADSTPLGTTKRFSLVKCRDTWYTCD